MFNKNRSLDIATDHSALAEQALIGSMLMNTEEFFIEANGKLTHDHFYDPFKKAVYKEATDLYSKNIEIDATVLAANLEANVELSEQEIYDALGAIWDSHPATDNISAWIDVVVDKYINRQLEDAGISIGELAHAKNFDRQEKINKIFDIGRKLEAVAVKDSIISTTDILASTVAMIEKNAISDDGVSGIPSGFTDLDQVTRGFQPTEFIVIGARPGMGKTSLVLSICNHCCAVLPVNERKKVLFYSLEMGKAQVGMRWLGARAKIPMDSMKSGRLTKDEAQRLRDALDESPDVTLHMDEKIQNIDEMCAGIRKKHAEIELDMVVIDYLQLIQDSPTARSSSNKSERVGDISRALKKLALELGIPVIALSQLNRDLEKRPDKRPITADLRESGAIEQDADIIIFVYRDEVYFPNTKEPGIAEIIVAKNRNGAQKTIKTKYDKPTTCFHNL